MASDLARSRAYIPLFTIRATVHPFSRLSPTEARQRLGPACFFLPSSLKKSRFRPGELISKVQSYLPCPFAATSIIDCSLRFFFFPLLDRIWPTLVRRRPFREPTPFSLLFLFSFETDYYYYFIFVYLGGEEVLFSLRFVF